MRTHDNQIYKGVGMDLLNLFRPVLELYNRILSFQIPIMGHDISIATIVIYCVLIAIVLKILHGLSD